MENPIATVRRTREIQERHNIGAKKSFGQNFIIEPRIPEKIADAAVDDPSDLVIEVGPGIGALTQYLCEKAKHVVAFEVDPRLPEVLKAEIESDNLEVILQDFLEADLKKTIEERLETGQTVRFASNLPYYITTPILFKLFESEAPIASATVMMQKEVADRFLARKNTSDYNALSVLTQYRCQIRKVMDVSRHVFSPKPNVDSAVLRFDFVCSRPVKDEKRFMNMVKACFVQRRKTLYNNLKAWLEDADFVKTMLEKAGLKPEIRAQQLDLEDFIRLYEENYVDLCARKSELGA